MLGVGYRCQFEPNHLECVRLAKEKVLGDVKIIDANFGFAMGDPNQWRLKRDLAGGGSLMDVGIYCLQTTRMLTGEDPVWINAAEVKTDAVKFKEVDETVLWQAKFPSGVVVQQRVHLLRQRPRGIPRRLLRAAFRLWSRRISTAATAAGAATGPEINMPVTDQFAVELEDFADCIINNKPTKVSGEMGLADVKFLTAIYESIKKGRPVSLA